MPRATPAPSTAASAAPAGADPAARDHLGHGLRTRHLTMMGLGSAIGAGLFLGSGVGIATAGPAVLVSYAIAGVLVVLVMRMLAEMASALPASGSFSVYAEHALGRWAGFTLGWVYWFTLIMVLGAEVTGVSRIVTGWLPGVPQWAVALVVVAVFAAANLAGVRKFGELEFWFALIKVVAIVVFLVLGVLLVLGLLPGTDPVGTTYLLGHGGFAPAGGGDGPAVLRRVSRRDVPWVAVLVSVAFGVVAVGLNWALPDTLLGILLNAVGAALLVVWVLVAVAQLRLRPRLEAEARERGEELPLRMWGYPWLTWATLAALAGLVVLMLADGSARGQLLSTAGLVAVVVGVYGVTVLVRRGRRRGAAAG